jgi:hypothetical protein
MNLKKEMYEDVNWIQAAQNRVWWLIYYECGNEPWSSTKGAEFFFTNLATVM